MKNCYMIDFSSIGNKDTGYLISLEENKNIPFDIKRIYYSYGVPANVKRGFHAHKSLKQILICINGSLKIKCLDGDEEAIYELNSKDKGLYVGPMLWHEMHDYEEGTVLMVLASDFYNEDDYIRNYSDFLELYKKTDLKSPKNYFVHEKAIVDSSIIGKDTRIWGFCHVFPGAKIGENCNLCEHVSIENDVILGDNVTVKCHVFICDGVKIEDNVFIGPGVSFINDTHPRSKQYPEEFSKTIIKENASLGANSTIMCGITIGECATVGAGSMVLKDVNPYEIVVGNPAKLIGYNCKCSRKLDFTNSNIARCSCGLTYEKKESKVIKI